MNVNTYYHIWAPHDDPLVRFLIDEQIRRMQLHSLIDQTELNVCVVGKAAKEVSKFVEQYPQVKLRNVVTKEKGWELHTLKLLYDDCHKDDGPRGS